MATHQAVATVGVKKPLEIIQVPTIAPARDEVRIRAEWAASTPLDLHQNDGGLGINTYPQVLGDSTAGTVVEIGPDVKALQVGDKVFGFTWRERKEKGQQEFITAPEWLFGKIPEGFTLQESVTLPNNFVTVFNSFNRDFGIELPWPKPEFHVPPAADDPFLIWGGASSVGQFAIQVLRYYGYKNVFVTASPRHHDLLRSYGATRLFDYRDANVVQAILDAASGGYKDGKAPIPYILDCIGSEKGSIAPILKIAKRGAKVAVLLPVIMRESWESDGPALYEMDAKKSADWEDGVDVRGVRTHFYLENEFFKYHLQSEIMPAMLEKGIVRPNRYRIVEGGSLLERAEKAMDALRKKEVSGERLVWRITGEKL